MFVVVEREKRSNTYFAWQGHKIGYQATSSLFPSIPFSTMKFSSACLLLLLQPASAFVGQSQRTAPRRSGLNVVTEPVELKEKNGAVAPVEEKEVTIKVEMPKVEPIKADEPIKKEEPVKKEEPKAMAPLPPFLEEKKEPSALEP